MNELNEMDERNDLEGDWKRPSERNKSHSSTLCYCWFLTIFLFLLFELALNGLNWLIVLRNWIIELLTCNWNWNDERKWRWSWKNTWNWNWKIYWFYYVLSFSLFVFVLCRSFWVYSGSIGWTCGMGTKNRIKIDIELTWTTESEMNWIEMEMEIELNFDIFWNWNWIIEMNLVRLKSPHRGHCSGVLRLNWRKKWNKLMYTLPMWIIINFLSIIYSYLERDIK